MFSRLNIIVPCRVSLLSLTGLSKINVRSREEGDDGVKFTLEEHMKVRRASMAVFVSYQYLFA